MTSNLTDGAARTRYMGVYLFICLWVLLCYVHYYCRKRNQIVAIPDLHMQTFVFTLCVLLRLFCAQFALIHFKWKHIYSLFIPSLSLSRSPISCTSASLLPTFTRSLSFISIHFQTRIIFHWYSRSLVQAFLLIATNGKILLSHFVGYES